MTVENVVPTERHARAVIVYALPPCRVRAWQNDRPYRIGALEYRPHQFVPVAVMVALPLACIRRPLLPGELVSIRRWSHHLRLAWPRRRSQRSDHRRCYRKLTAIARARVDDDWTPGSSVSVDRRCAGPVTDVDAGGIGCRAVQVATSKVPEHVCASAGSDMPSDKGASAEAARSQDFRRFTVTLDSTRRCRRLPMAWPPKAKPATARRAAKGHLNPWVAYTQAGERVGAEVGGIQFRAAVA